MRLTLVGRQRSSTNIHTHTLPTQILGPRLDWPQLVLTLPPQDLVAKIRLLGGLDRAEGPESPEHYGQMNARQRGISVAERHRRNATCTRLALGRVILAALQHGRTELLSLVPPLIQVLNQRSGTPIPEDALIDGGDVLLQVQLPLGSALLSFVAPLCWNSVNVLAGHVDWEQAVAEQSPEELISTLRRVSGFAFQPPPLIAPGVPIPNPLIVASAHLFIRCIKLAWGSESEGPPPRLDIVTALTRELAHAEATIPALRQHPHIADFLASIMGSAMEVEAEDEVEAVLHIQLQCILAPYWAPKTLPGGFTYEDVKQWMHRGLDLAATLIAADSLVDDGKLKIRWSDVKTRGFLTTVLQIVSEDRHMLSRAIELVPESYRIFVRLFYEFDCPEMLPQLKGLVECGLPLKPTLYYITAICGGMRHLFDFLVE